ncbi:hypothetical protein IAQ61_001222 [Plenodomus lingam]|uniref:uncharacterized protein n=1 Tax=Leptosphaeria maculans TaxID=5022 RepID=UPI00331B1866|nr:hypothetical protein IAQ61_001222 [Plenodomus lingam]
MKPPRTSEDLSHGWKLLGESSGVVAWTVAIRAWAERAVGALRGHETEALEGRHSAAILSAATDVGTRGLRVAEAYMLAESFGSQDAVFPSIHRNVKCKRMDTMVELGSRSGKQKEGQEESKPGCKRKTQNKKTRVIGTDAQSARNGTFRERKSI